MNDKVKVFKTTNPCKECITQAVCKANIYPHINDHDTILMHIHQHSIKPKCNKIWRIAKEELDINDQPMALILGTMLREIFK